MRNIQNEQIDIPNTPTRLETRFANLKGPTVTLIGRDIRLALDNGQTSPQEMWHTAKWDGTSQSTTCPDPHRTGTLLGFKNQIKYGLYTQNTLETDIGGLKFSPHILYRARLLTDLQILRPYGLILGASAALPLADNTHYLLYSNARNPHEPVRRDMTYFDNSPALTRLYASYQATPLAHTHLKLTAGYTDDMYASLGLETLYRPFPSNFWLGADIWSAWRRNPRSLSNLKLTSHHTFTGHLRAGYDHPNAQTSFYTSFGRYLAKDWGTTLGLSHDFKGGATLNAHITWSERSENDAVFAYSKIEPALQLIWPLGKQNTRHTKSYRLNVHQLGRDSGQMLNRPQPLEAITKPFSATQIAKYWNDMHTPHMPNKKNGVTIISAP